MVSRNANLFSPEGILQYFRPYAGRVYVREAYLLLLGFSPKVLAVRKSQFTKGTSKRWAWMKVASGDGFEIIYDYETIPTASQQSNGLPMLGEVLVHFSESVRKRYTRKSLCTVYGREEVRLELFSAIASAGNEIDYFFDRNLELSGSSLIAKKYCVVKKLLQFIDDIPASRNKLYEIISGSEFENLGFPQSLKSFYRYLDLAKKAEDLRKFVKDLVHPKSNAQKRNEMVDKLVLIAASHINEVSIKMIRIWVNTILLAFPAINGSKKIEDTTVQTILDDHKALSKIFKLGEDYIRKHIIPFFELINAVNPWDQWQMDEWHIEFKARDRSSTKRLIMFTIMDAASRKVIHVEFCENLDSEVVRKAISEAVIKSSGRFPAEIVSDFSTSNTADIMKDIFDYVKASHPEFHWTISSNPNRKAILERWFGTLNSMWLSPHFGQTGTGWGEREYSGPAKFVEYLLNRPELLEDIEGLKAMITGIIDQYNSNGTHPDILSPNEFISSHRAVNAIGLPLHEIAFMFGKKFTRGMTNTTVECEVGNKNRAPMTRKYKSHSPILAKYTEDEVDFYINDMALDIAFIFAKDSSTFLGDAHEFERFHTAHINKTKKDTEILDGLLGERKAMIKKLMAEKPDAIAALSKITGVAIDEFLHQLTKMNRPVSSDISDVTGDKDGTVTEINPFNPPSRKGYQKSRGQAKKQKKAKKQSEASRPTIMSKGS